jgi:threonylcarbamoyladenosine tRNA methylthiotransferase MtaB
LTIVNTIRAAFNNSAITTDIMVGFPGETREEFEASLAFVESVGFAKAQVFAYSARAGTTAALLKPHVPKSDKDNRSRRMIDAAEQAHRRFLASQVGRTEPVVFEMRDGDVNVGYTMNYTPIGPGSPIRSSLRPAAKCRRGPEQTPAAPQQFGQALEME